MVGVRHSVYVNGLAQNAWATLQIDQSVIHGGATRGIDDPSTQIDGLVDSIAIRGSFFGLGFLRRGAGGQQKRRKRQPQAEHNESGLKPSSGRAMRTKILHSLPLHPRESVT